MKEEKVMGVMGIFDAHLLAVEVTGIIYNQSKARLFTFLETQFEGKKLEACKSLVHDVITDVSSNAGRLVKDVLGHWHVEVETGGHVSDEESAQALKEFEEAEKILG